MPPPTVAPRATLVPCDVCGSGVDPVRAPFVAVIDERYRFYCSRACRDRAGVQPPQRHRQPADHPRAPTVLESAVMLGLPRDSLPARVVDPSLPDPELPTKAVDTPTDTLDAPPDATLAAVALALALVALAVASPESVSVSLRAGVLALVAMASLGLAVRPALAAWRSGHTGPAVGLVGAVVPLLALPRDALGFVSALRDVAAVAAVVPCAGWVVGARSAAGRERLDALRVSLTTRASVVHGELTEVLHAARVRVGEQVEVSAGMTVPVDGIVHSGEGLALLYPAALEPRRRIPGDAVLAGARVTQGILRVLATRAGDEVAWARLGRLLSSGAARPRAVTLALQSSMAAPGVLAGIALVTAVVRGFMGVGNSVSAAAWLLALAPCASVATLVNLPFLDALGSAARRGVVFRDAAGVDAAAQVGTVVLCARGTVTRGRAELTEVVSFGSRSETDILGIVASVEGPSPMDSISRAVSDAAVRRGVPTESVRRVVRVPGQGITAVASTGESLVVGSRRLLLTEGVPVAPAEDVAQAIEGAGRTVVLLAMDGRVEGLLGLEDPVRDEARSAVQAMIDAGLEVALLSGGSRGTLEAMGAMLDVVNLRPEVLPEERAAVVRSLSETGRGVAVVGRTARDSAALSAADVAISMEAAGGAGTDTAVALASDDLRDAAEALRLARRGRDRAVGVASVGVVTGLIAVGMDAVAPGWGALGVVLLLGAVVAAEALTTREV